jgi:hypothetical protein
VQLTVVVPTGKALPDAGEQVVVTGGVPPVVTGLEYVTFCPADALVTVTFAGHATTGTPTGVTGSVVVGPLQSATRATRPAAMRMRVQATMGRRPSYARSMRTTDGR